MTEQEYLHWLVHIQGIGPVTIKKLYTYFKSFREIWKAEEQKLTASKCLRGGQMQALLSGKAHMEACRREYENLKKQGIHFVTFLDADYPKRLLPLYDRPAGLFVKGKMPRDDVPSAAIVGARDCTEYGRDAAGFMAQTLAKAGVSVISGLALGIDAAAHKGALAAGKETFGVLGCGINICYPRENHALYSAMEREGGILTEFIPGTKPEAGNFPQRNRIISGLSDAVIIIEAKEKSGSLITADLALEQGREIFALPGRINDPLSRGCNRLIQNGAAILLDPGEVLELFGFDYERKLILSKISEKRLEKRENLLYSFLDSRPKHLDEIRDGCGLDVSECMEGLLRLELLGIVHGIGNQYYCRKL
ncbi:MAG: DNA-protecting protein DprA [Lachnospiraceae bacterium]|nr:DNA-protecting protein DprA [Lachnospiraceae bacterium]